MTRWLAVTGLCLLTLACGPRYVTGTQVEYSDEREEVAKVIERYRVALEQRDTAALRALTSKRYYENASTTEDPNDDYDAAGMEKVLSELKGSVKTVKYQIEIADIQVVEDAASVDVEYTAQFLYAVAEQDRWATSADKNRFVLRREDGSWKFLNGM